MLMSRVQFTIVIKNNILISCMDIMKTLLSSVLKKPMILEVQLSMMRRQ